jgi:hypothetical protein
MLGLLCLLLSLSFTHASAYISEQQVHDVTQTITNVPYYFVDNNLSDIDSSGDHGSHANFTAQQYGPDASYDTVTEELQPDNTHSLDATGGYMIVGDGSPDWGSPSGTISFWVKMDGTVQGRFWGQDGNMETRWTGSNLTLDWGSDTTMTSATTFSADTWYFVAIVWDETNNNLFLYIGDETNPPTLDANSLSATWLSTTPLPTQNRFMNGLGANQPVDGHGDDLRYWSTARSIAELQSDYDLELTGTETNLQSYFQLNNDFDDIGPSDDNGSGSGSYTFSSDVPFSDSNYALDLEVQWTNVDYSETNEELCINFYDGLNNTHSLDATGGYMIVGDGSPDWGSPSGTISFWVKMDGTVQGRLWGQEGNMETRWATTNLVLDWGSAGSMTSATAFTANQWYFIAIVWDETANNLFLYIGDQSNAPTLDANSLSGTWTGTTPLPTENRFLNGLGGSEPVDGHGDELRYWNITRSLAELQSDYNITLSGSESGLRSYFRLDNSFTDEGPDANDGIASGSYAFTTDVPFMSEALQIDVWTGAAWQNIFSNLTTGWNNATVTSYLTSSTFTIRFAGSSETNDNTQHSWSIDATVLHAWS